jgi:catechol 2,3-dioxygenase-like lactoylglutathione lyase family enzyme
VRGGTRLTIAVVRYADGWRVFGPRGGGRHFSYKVDAEEAALRAARQAPEAEGGVQVLVQERWGELRRLEGVD